jgi:hypothetical protein
VLLLWRGAAAADDVGTQQSCLDHGWMALEFDACVLMLRST